MVAGVPEGGDPSETDYATWSKLELSDQWAVAQLSRSRKPGMKASTGKCWKAEGRVDCVENAHLPEKEAEKLWLRSILKAFWRSRSICVLNCWSIL